jgi:glutaredoxin
MRSRWLAILILLLCIPAAHGQYKWVDADGRIGYGDKPPPGARHIESLSGVTKGVQPNQEAQLPYQLQRTVKDFPVTLYTTSECAPCDAGRSMLKARAIPFTERTVRNADDAEALKKLTGADRMPAFQVGSRIVTGFSNATWDEVLDLAGYPHGGSLPADWVWPAPTPLTQVKPAPPAPPEAAAPPSSDNSKEQ